MRYSRSPQTRHAFTLIELLLVMVILGILAAIVVPKFTNRTGQAKIAAAKADISGMATALDAFEVDNGRYPSTDEGLTALMNPPSNIANWKGPYLSKPISHDPWEHPYVYRFPGTHNVKSYDLISCGPDGQEGSADDIDNWANSSSS